MAEEDIFGQPIADDPEAQPPDVGEPEPDAAEGPETDTGDETTPQDTLQSGGDEPTDLEGVRRHWQAAYTRSRQKDREKYGQLEQEHQQYKQVLANFYQDEAYAKQVLAQRFPQLAGQLGQTGQAPQGSPSDQPSGLTARLEQKLGEFGFLAKGIGEALEDELESRVQARIAPLEQRTTQQAHEARKAEEGRLLAAMDGKYPGWEDSYGADMQELDTFLGSDALDHARFGNKYELYYRLLNPDAQRGEAIREMGNASRNRTGLGRTGRSTAPNLGDLVQKAESNATAFELAAKAALEETG